MPHFQNPELYADTHSNNTGAKWWRLPGHTPSLPWGELGHRLPCIWVNTPLSRKFTEHWLLHRLKQPSLPFLLWKRARTLSMKVDSFNEHLKPLAQTSISQEMSLKGTPGKCPLSRGGWWESSPGACEDPHRQGWSRRRQDGRWVGTVAGTPDCRNWDTQQAVRVPMYRNEGSASRKTGTVGGAVATWVTCGFS